MVSHKTRIYYINIYLLLSVIRYLKKKKRPKKTDQIHKHYIKYISNFQIPFQTESMDCRKLYTLLLLLTFFVYTKYCAKSI